MEEPTNMELMRRIEELSNEIGKMRNCLVGPNYDNGLLKAYTALGDDHQALKSKVCRLEKGIIGICAVIFTAVVNFFVNRGW